MRLYRLTDEGIIPFPIERYIDSGNQIEHKRGPTQPSKLQLAYRCPVVPMKKSFIRVWWEKMFGGARA